MTRLQDARLKKALDFAPDSALAPAKSIGDAIQFEANRVLQSTLSKPPQGHWARIKAWWLPPGHMPWNAAFASLLLASMVTLVWRGEDTPGAEPEAPPAQPVAAAPSATPTPAPVQAPPQAVPRQQTDAPREPPAAPAVRARPRVPAETAVADAAAPPVASPSVASPPAASPAPAEVMATAPQPSALRVAPAAKAAQSIARAESAGALVDAKAFAVAEAWTALRVTSGGAAREVLRPSSPDWVAVVRRLLAVAVTPAPLEGEPALQINLLQGEATLGQLAVAGSWVRWTPTGGLSRTGQVDATLLRDLRALVAAEQATPPDSAR